MHKIPSSMLDQRANMLTTLLAVYIRCWPDKINGKRSETHFSGFSLKIAAKYHLKVRINRIVGNKASLNKFYNITKRGKFNVYETLDPIEKSGYFLLPDEVFREHIPSTHKLCLIICFKLRAGKTLALNNKKSLAFVLSRFTGLSENRCYEIVKDLTTKGYLRKTAPGHFTLNESCSLVKSFIERLCKVKPKLIKEEQVEDDEPEFTTVDYDDIMKSLESYREKVQWNSEAPYIGDHYGRADQADVDESRDAAPIEQEENGLVIGKDSQDSEIGLERRRSILVLEEMK